ncbi:MAG: RecX family transcriptional regulator [Lachnospiraceae bacterium]|nr:RecX family transcriptional regulator [Lachnospiraceae bacterium]
MIISSITEFSKKKLKILFEDSSFLVVYKGMVDVEFTELSDEDYERLFKDMLNYGKRRAMNLLMTRDRSVKELTEKLEEDGYNQVLIDAVIDFLNKYSYLNDSRVAEQIVRSFRNSKSVMELRQVLKRRGISEEEAEKAIEVFYNQNDFEEEGTSAETVNDNEILVIQKFLNKIGMTKDKLSELDYQEKNKLAAKLYRKGFKSENIRKAISLSEYE